MTPLTFEMPVSDQFEWRISKYRSGSRLRVNLRVLRFTGVQGTESHLPDIVQEILEDAVAGLSYIPRKMPWDIVESVVTSHWRECIKHRYVSI